MGRAILIYLATINLIAFLAFGWDKRAARLGRRRVPEKRLLLFAFLLGAPGAWFGARTFRHKTVKTSFRVKLALVTALDVVLVGVALWWYGRGRGWFA